MKRIILSIVILGAIFAGAGVVVAQNTGDGSALPSINDILKKYVAAVGGEAAIKKVTSRYARGTIEIPAMGVSGPTESWAKVPNRTMFIVSFPGFGEVKQGFDGTAGWSIDPFSGNRDLDGSELAQTKRNAEFYADLMMTELFPTLTVKGKSKVGEQDAWVVEAVPAEGDAEKFYYDVGTGLLVRRDFEAESPQGKMPTESYFEDYREIDGVKMPFTIRQINPAFTLLIKFEEVKHNVAIDDEKFKKPGS